MTDKESGIDPGKLAAGSKSLLSARTTKIRWKAEQNSKKYMSVLCFALPSFFVLLSVALMVKISA